MGNSFGRVLKFPKRPSPISSASFQTRDAQADAELRAALLGKLIEELGRKERERPDSLTVKMACMAALELLNELTVLYRRALSETRGGNDHG